jgi:hypothetical protein
MKNTGPNRIPPVAGHVVNLTLNIVVIAILYLFLGATASYGLSRVVPSFDDKWKALPMSLKFLDVSLEISAIVLTSFWITYMARSVIPIFPVSSGLEQIIESFGGQVSFLYAVFIFLEVLDDKLIHVYKEIFG